MNLLLTEIQHNRLLWLLVFVPVVFAAETLRHDAHTLLFVLSVLAIVPLAALLSHATESVAAKTGDAVGGLLNATLGNLTELVIALTALRAGQYVLVKASLAGAIVTNTLFMLGASLLLGGLKYHVQEYNRVSARMQASLLFLATVALLIPSAVSQADSVAGAAFTQKLSVGLSILLIIAYGLGMLYSLKTHPELFASAESGEAGHAPWPMALALATLAGVTVLVALVSEIFVESVQKAAETFGMTPAFVGFIVVALVGARGGNGLGVFGRAQEPAGFERRHRARQRVPNRALRGARAGAPELCPRPDTDGPAVLAWCGGHDAHRHDDRLDGDQRRPLGVVRGCPAADGLCDLRHDALPVATPSGMNAPFTQTTATFNPIWPMTPTRPTKRVLEPIDRVSEVLFGLIMVLTFTGSLSVADAGRDDVRTMLIGALGCNVAWGIIDAMLYLMGRLADKGQSLMTYLAVRRTTDPHEGPAPHRRRVAAGGRVDPGTGGTGNDAPTADAIAGAAGTRASEQGRVAGIARRVSGRVRLHVSGGAPVHLHAECRAGPACVQRDRHRDVVSDRLRLRNHHRAPPVAGGYSAWSLSGPFSSA